MSSASLMRWITQNTWNQSLALEFQHANNLRIHVAPVLPLYVMCVSDMNRNIMAYDTAGVK
jgi:hypothetical protein